MPRLACLFLFLAAVLPAANLPSAEPESEGMSSQRLSRIGEWLDSIIERKQAAGFVTIVARRGKVVHHEARGTRGLTVKDPMPLDALFDMASMTKAITVTAALMLLEDSQFTLEDSISEYLPGFKNPTVQVGPKSFKPADSEITIRQLFTRRLNRSTEQQFNRTTRSLSRLSSHSARAVAWHCGRWRLPQGL